MQLIVNREGIQVILRRAARITGTEWYFKSPGTTAEASTDPSHGPNPKTWIILRGSEGGKSVEIAIRTRSQQRRAWDALVAAGIQPVNSLPD
jgi:hypothetical protein